MDDEFDLGEIANAARLEAWKADKDARRDEKYVLYILKELGLTFSKPRLRKFVEEQTGTDYLTVAWLSNVLEGWPMWLTSLYVPFIYRKFMPDLYNRFTTTNVYDTFINAKAMAPEHWGKSVGVIFTAANIRKARGALVLHNTVTPIQEGKTLILHRVRNEDLVIERLCDLVERLKGKLNLRLR